MLLSWALSSMFPATRPTLPIIHTMVRTWRSVPSLHKTTTYQRAPADPDASVCRKRRLKSSSSIFSQARGLQTRVAGFAGQGKRRSQGLVYVFQQAIQHSGQGAARNGLEAQNRTPPWCGKFGLRRPYLLCPCDSEKGLAVQFPQMSVLSYQSPVICGRHFYLELRLESLIRRSPKVGDLRAAPTSPLGCMHQHVWMSVFDDPC